MAYVARTSATLGYIKEYDAWPYIKVAADNASKIYSGWIEYLAAYYLGRAIAYGGRVEGFPEIVRLLQPKTSPFKGIDFR